MRQLSGVTWGARVLSAALWVSPGVHRTGHWMVSHPQTQLALHRTPSGTVVLLTLGSDSDLTNQTGLYLPKLNITSCLHHRQPLRAALGHDLLKSDTTMEWVSLQKTSKLVSFQFPFHGTPSTSPACSKPHPLLAFKRITLRICLFL